MCERAGAGRCWGGWGAMASWAAGASECRSSARVRYWTWVCYAGRSVAPRAMPRRAMRACLRGLQAHAAAIAGLYHDLEAAGSMAPMETHTLYKTQCVCRTRSQVETTSRRFRALCFPKTQQRRELSLRPHGKARDKTHGKGESVKGAQPRPSPIPPVPYHTARGQRAKHHSPEPAQASKPIT